MNKTLLIAATAAFLLVPSAAKAEGWYVGAYGGANWDDVISTPFVSDNTGYVIGGVVGTGVSAVPGMRIEADMSFRQNDVDVKIGPGIDVSHDTFALMGNVVYDLPVNIGPMVPYAMAGVGYGHTEATFENIALAKLEASGVAWQLGAGVNTQLADNVTLGVGYRYFSGPEIEILGTQLSDGTNHSVVAQLTFGF